MKCHWLSTGIFGVMSQEIALSLLWELQRSSVKKWIWLLACVCSSDAESVDHSSKMLLHMAQQLQRLVCFYQFIRREHQIPPTYSTVVADDLNSPQVGPHTSSSCCHPAACEGCLSSCREAVALFVLYAFLIVESFSSVYFIAVAVLFL